jgi:hypothetical protein
MKDCNGWKPFSTRVLPPVIQKFVEDGAAAIGCDPAAIAAGDGLEARRQLQLLSDATGTHLKLGSDIGNEVQDV